MSHEDRVLSVLEGLEPAGGLKKFDMVNCMPHFT